MITTHIDAVYIKEMPLDFGIKFHNRDHPYLSRLIH